MGQTIHRGQYGFLHQAVNMLFNAVKWGIIIEKRMGAGFSLQWHQEELQFFSSGGCPCTTNRIQWKIQVCKSTLLSSYYLHDILNVIISKLILIQFLSAVAKKAKKTKCNICVLQVFSGSYSSTQQSDSQRLTVFSWRSFNSMIHCDTTNRFIATMKSHRKEHFYISIFIHGDKRIHA